MKLGYFGPAGTFTHAALLASPFAAGAEAVPFGTERDTILAAESGAVDASLVPIENSLEGGVNATLDTLALDAEGVRIVGESVLPVTHALIARPGVTIADVVAVVSHPQPLGQCRKWLGEHLPGRRRVAATSTAEAVRLVSESLEPEAAIGTLAAARLYGCSVLAEGIEDEHGNATRFLWVARVGTDPFGTARRGAAARGGEGAGPAASGRSAGAGDSTGPPDSTSAADSTSAGPPGGGRAKTSIVFHGAGDNSPGWLVRCLSELAFRGINLTRIESRPLKRSLGHYLFLVDLQGHEEDPQVAEAIVRLQVHCEVVRVLGSYPAAV